MKSLILILAVTIAALSSCTTAYKTGQTPDDVYYSAPRPQTDDERTESQDRRDYTYSDEYYDDRYLRMKVRNRYRWNDLNDWYSYDRYSFGYNYYFGSYYNPYNSWNYYYNPYCCCHSNYYNFGNPHYASVKPIVKPRTFNLNGYTNNNYNNTNNTGNTKTAVRTSSSRPVYNNTNSNTNSNPKGLSNTVRTIFERNNNNSSGSSGSSSSSSRTYTPSSSSSSSGSSSSGSSSSSSGSSGGGVSRPGRN